MTSKSTRTEPGWRQGIDAISSGKIAEINCNWPRWQHRCTEFETKFIGGILERWRIYYIQMELSAKQRNLLTEIYDKIKD